MLSLTINYKYIFVAVITPLSSKKRKQNQINFVNYKAANGSFFLLHAVYDEIPPRMIANKSRKLLLKSKQNKKPITISRRFQNNRQEIQK